MENKKAKQCENNRPDSECRPPALGTEHHLGHEFLSICICLSSTGNMTICFLKKHGWIGDPLKGRGKSHFLSDLFFLSEAINFFLFTYVDECTKIKGVEN